MVSALEWAEIRALARDGVSQREIARRLGINRRTVARALAADAPPRYVRAPAGSQLDPLMGVIGRVLEQWPEIKAPRLTELLRDRAWLSGVGRSGPPQAGGVAAAGGAAGAADGYRPGQVVQFDWGEMPTRPRIGGVERRVYALVASLPFSGAQTAHFSFDMTLESFLEGHVRVFDWLGGVPRECVYDNLRSVGGQARQPPGGALEPAVLASARPLRVSLDGVHAGDAAGEGIGRGRGPVSEDRVLAGAAVSDAGRARSGLWRLA